MIILAATTIIITILFGRNGKALGLLNWTTDKIYLMHDGKFDLTKEELKKMENGDYVIRREVDVPKQSLLDKIKNLRGK